MNGLSEYNRERTPWLLLGVMISFMLSTLFKLPQAFIWGCRIVILILICKSLNKNINKNLIDKPGYTILLIFMFWLFISFLRACIYAKGYWMWKMVIDQFILLCFYIVVLVATNINIIRNYFRLYWIMFIPLVLFSFIFTNSPKELNYMPFMVLALLFVFVPKTKRLQLLAIATLYVATFQHRNDLMKVLIAFIIGIFFTYFYRLLSERIIRLIYIILLTLPIVLLSIGAIGIFNVFKMDEYIKGDYSFNVESSEGNDKREFTTDTRTLIYENVFYTLNKYDAWIIGRSPAYGDEGIMGAFADEIIGTDLKGRYGNEVGIMDILLWYGIVGVVLYFLLFARASYVAIYKSQNRVAKAIGLYTAYLWLMSFIWEKPMFETFFMVDLILIGLCFSKSIRQMTDDEMRLWIQSIFTKHKIRNQKDYERTMAFERPFPRSV